MIPIIDLDRESFQDIFEKARKRIPVLFPQWTNFNESDSGIALLELFCWLKEMQEFHMNQIGREQLKLYLKLLGMKPQKARPAYALVRCYGVEREELLNAGHKFVAGETGFQSVEDVLLYSGNLIRLAVLDQNGEILREKIGLEERRKVSLPLFGTDVKVGNMLELTFDRPFQPGERYGFYCSLKEGDRVKRNPVSKEFLPLAGIHVEYLASSGWTSCQLIRDDTKAMIQSGIIQIRLPYEPSDDGLMTYRVRICLDWEEYDIVPVLEYIDLNPVELIQCKTMVTQAQELGLGTGFPNQEYPVGFSGILKDSVRVMAEHPECPGTFEEWSQVEDFGSSGPEDRHYIVEEETDHICFGDNIHGMAPEGEIRLLDASQTRGILGNVTKRQIHEILSPDGKKLPFEAVNEENARDGANAETLEECFERFQAELFDLGYAVTEEDYENMVLRTPGLMIAKAKVVELDSVANRISIAVKPWSDRMGEGLSRAYYANIVQYMGSRRLIGTDLRILKPEYVRINLYLNLELLAYYQETDSSIKESLIHFFQETQSEFGKPVLYGALYGFLDRMQSLKRIHSLTIDAVGLGIERNMRGDVILPPNGLASLDQIFCSISFSG